MKNDTTFVRILEAKNCPNQAARFVKFKSITDKTGFNGKNEEGRSTKCCLRFFNFCLRN